jgi:hypothetical protein
MNRSRIQISFIGFKVLSRKKGYRSSVVTNMVISQIEGILIEGPIDIGPSLVKFTQFVVVCHGMILAGGYDNVGAPSFLFYEA